MKSAWTVSLSLTHTHSLSLSLHSHWPATSRDVLAQGHAYVTCLYSNRHSKTDAPKSVGARHNFVTGTIASYFDTPYNKDGRWCAHGRRLNKTDKWQAKGDASKQRNGGRKENILNGSSCNWGKFCCFATFWGNWSASSDIDRSFCGKSTKYDSGLWNKPSNIWQSYLSVMFNDASSCEARSVGDVINLLNPNDIYIYVVPQR